MGTLNCDDNGLWAQQAPDAFLDYSLDWADWLTAGDAIATSTWQASDDLQLSDDDVSGARTVVWVQGGQAGKWYALKNTVVSTEGRTDTKAIRLRIIADNSAAITGTRLFPDPSQIINEMRKEQLSMAAGYVLPKNRTFSDAYLMGKLRAAEADAARTLRCFFGPTKIIPEEAEASEIQALTDAGTYFAQEPGYDYNQEQFAGDQWGYIATNHKPIISVESVAFVYPAPTRPVFEVPQSWLKVDRKAGHIRIVPAANMLSAAIPAFIMPLMLGGRTMPLMLRVRYTAGLANAARDFPDLLDTVKKMATLRLLQDLFPPQSGSISADGLSQSLSLDMEKWHDGIADKLSELRDAIHGPRLMVMG